MDRLDAEFLANWSCYSGVVLIELAAGGELVASLWSCGCGQSVGIVVRAIGSR